MPLGLFKGVRTYSLAPQGGGTSFTMREEYSGPLLGMMWRSMPDLGPSFKQFVNGLKQRVEARRLSRARRGLAAGRDPGIRSRRSAIRTAAPS